MDEKKHGSPQKSFRAWCFPQSLRLLLHGTSIGPAKNAGNVNGNSTDSIMEKIPPSGGIIAAYSHLL